MRNDAYYGIQFAQSLYMLLGQCGRFKDMTAEVFAKDSEISLTYGDEKCEGLAAVENWFADFEQKTKDNGGLVRLDVPTTQYIEAGADDETAIGHWTTFSYIFDGTAPGNVIKCVIGQFTNTFVLEDHIWKMTSVNWQELLPLGPWTTGPDPNLEGYLSRKTPWIDDLPSLKPLDELAASAQTMEILRLRNQILKYMSVFNQTGAMPEVECYCTIAVSEKIAQLTQNLNKMLVTSPVLKLSDDLSEAEAFFSVAALNQTSDTEVANTRGSLDMKLKREGDGWKVVELDWYAYATLDPWKVYEG